MREISYSHLFATKSENEKPLRRIYKSFSVILRGESYEYKNTEEQMQCPLFFISPRIEAPSAKDKIVLDLTPDTRTRVTKRLEKEDI